MGSVKETTIQEHQLILLGQALQTLREADGADSLIEVALGYLRSVFAESYELLWIGLYDRVDHRILGKGGVTPTSSNAGSGPSGRSATAFQAGQSGELKQRLTLVSGDILEQVVIQQRPLAIADLRQEMRAGEWRKLAQKYNIQGTMLFPLCYRDRCFGVVIIGTQRWGTFPGTTEKAAINMVLGELAALLNQAELDWQRQQQKRSDKPLVRQIDRTRILPDFGRRLEVVIEETHQFFEPTRTSLYWFEPNQRYFWRRLTNQAPRTTGLLNPQVNNSGITAQEINSFYQQLLNDQVVAIGEAQSSLRADATTRLMQLMRARSLLAAPILSRTNQLLGFLAIEGAEPRIWQDEEKAYLRAAGQLIALMEPLDHIETILEQNRLDQSITTEIARSLYSSNDWKSTLNRSAELLGQRLKTERLMVLLPDPQTGQFEVCFQHQPRNRRTISNHLPPLSAIDLQLAERTEQTIAIETLEEDLRFESWRAVFWDMGLRSLMIASTAPGQRLDGLLVIGHEMPRSWTIPEQQLVQFVAQQLGVILNQWKLQRQVEKEFQTHQHTQRCIQMLQQCDHLEDLEQVALRMIAPIFEAPLSFLVSWFPGRRTGRLVIPQMLDRRYALIPNTKVSIHADPLLKLAQEHQGLLAFRAEQIPGETRQWLNPQGMTQVIAIALRMAPDDVPSGLLCLAYHEERQLDDRQQNTLMIIAGQLAAARRHLKLESTLQSERLKLEQIGWYKHRHLEELHRSVQNGIQRLVEAEKPSGQDALASTRNQQILRYIGDAMVPVQSALLNEQWQLQFRQETVLLLGLLRRSLDRVDQVLKQRQLWSQVHQDSNPIVVGDAGKLEMILYEVILTAAQRSEAGQRIDIWCRQFDQRWIEVAITDQGNIESRLLQDLEGGQPLDPIAPNLLNQPPGLHLAICKELLLAMGSELTVSRLEDGRIMTRLMLPSAKNNAQTL